jgi:hypothetical protein
VLQNRRRRLLPPLLRGLGPPQDERHHCDGLCCPTVSPSAARPPVICCIENASACSRAALDNAARMALGRRSNGGVDMLVMVVRRSPLFCAIDPAFELVWTDGSTRDSIPADIRALINATAGYFGLAIRVEEIYGWSQAEIARTARTWRCNAVILPMLGHKAGRAQRWRRRSLVSGLVIETGAVVIDEYDRPCGDGL